MQEVIKKAIEGGYKPDLAESLFPKNGLQVQVLNSLFWQALGKACGWGLKDKFYCGNKECNQYNDKNNSWDKRGYCRFCGVMQIQYTAQTDNPNWKFIALQFHEINLTQSWDDAVKYLSELVKEN